MYTYFPKTLALSCLFFALNVQAMEFDKPTSVSVTLHNNQKHFGPSGFSANPVLPPKKTVMLMKIKLTAQQKQVLSQAPNNKLRTAAQPTFSGFNLPHQYDRGMNGTPVLDQGMHGACTTFATTAAVDALLGKGDYISQLCQLSLGSYFEQNGYLPSGWDGTSGAYALNQIIGFGIINKSNQKAKSCGKLNDYPLTNPYNTGSPMSLEEFKNTSENLNEQLDWESILTFNQRFEWGSRGSTTQADALLMEVKKTIALRKPYMDTRVTFGTLLPLDYCEVGACARYHVNNDTWALTNAIMQDQKHNYGGHEMIIIGYNDDAIAIDNEGKSHQGLLILRNSWGSEAGDQGNYYMTYDFFKQFVLEVQKIMLDKTPH